MAEASQVEIKLMLGRCPGRDSNPHGITPKGF
jgi:hypothetical protein